MSDDTLKLLLTRYLAGRVTAEEARALSARLRVDPEGRRWLREMSLHATAIVDLAEVQQRAPRPVPTTPYVVPRSWTDVAVTWTGWALAAGLLIFAAVTMREWRRPQPPALVVQVEEVRGTVTFTRAGQLSRVLAEGTQLPAGTIETEPQLGAARLRFSDGTTLTLDSGTRLTFGDRGQKLLELGDGSLSAAVTRQPAGRPMIVRTGTAEAEILGTKFTLRSEPERTTLEVERGEVVLKRLADGQRVAVTDESRATATHDSVAPLRAEKMKGAPAHWRLTFENPSDLARVGDWQQSAGGDPGRVRAAVFNTRQAAAGAPLAIRCVSVKSAGSAFATLHADSVLKLRVRLQRSFPIAVLLSTTFPHGAFNGNFEVRNAGGGKLAPGQWHDLTVPIANFNPVPHPQGTPSAAGNELRLVHLSTYIEDVGLEVASIEVVSPSASR